MSVFAASIITLFSFGMLTWHLSRETMLKIAGYAAIIDVCIHVGVIWMFMGTSTLGLMQAELSAIMFTLALRAYRYLRGYSRLRGTKWVTYRGYLA